jgi:hypothetical protein
MQEGYKGEERKIDIGLLLRWPTKLVGDGESYFAFGIWS